MNLTFSQLLIENQDLRVEIENLKSVLREARAGYVALTEYDVLKPRFHNDAQLIVNKIDDILDRPKTFK